MWRLNTHSCSTSRDWETSRLLNGLCDSVLASASDVLADVEGRWEKGEVRCDAPSACAAPGRTSPLSLLPFSDDPIDEGTQKYDDADDPVRGEEGRIEV